MTDESLSPRRVLLDDRLLTWAEILAGAGAVLMVAAAAIGGAAVRRAVQDWYVQLEQAPSSLARSKWQQLVNATSAGATAWKSGPAA